MGQLLVGRATSPSSSGLRSPEVQHKVSIPSCLLLLSTCRGMAHTLVVVSSS